MLLEELTPKSFDRYRAALVRYARYRWRFRLKLAYLVTLSTLAALLIGAVLAWLVCNAGRTADLIFLIINGAFCVFSYLFVIFHRPWAGMLYLPPKRYPELYRKVRWIARTMKVGRIGAIYVGHDFNAAVAEKWTFIPFLRSRVLMLGAPLLFALDSRAFSAMLAHEFGHIAGGHLRTDALFLRLFAFWNALDLGILTWVLVPFKRYLLRELEFLHLPIRRRAEVFADDFIIRRFGLTAEQACLTQIAVRGELYAEDAELIDEFASGEPGKTDFAAILRSHVRRPIAPEDALARLNRLAQEIPPVNEEHPAFASRVRTRDLAELLSCLEETPDALEKLFAREPGFYAEFDAWCEKDLRPTLDAYRRDTEDARRRLAEFGREHASETDLADMLNLADLYGTPERYDELLAEAAARFPAIVSFRAMQACRRLKTAGAAERAQVFRELDDAFAAHPLLTVELNDIVLERLLKQGARGRVRKFFVQREAGRAMAENVAGLALGKDDLLSPAMLSASEKSALSAAAAEAGKHVLKVYAVWRRYDPAVLAADRFLLIERRGGSFRLGPSDDDLCGEFYAPELAGFLPRIADSAELGILRAHGIAPVWTRDE